jgi:hypothetical protein
MASSADDEKAVEVIVAVLGKFSFWSRRRKSRSANAMRPNGLSSISRKPLQKTFRAVKRELRRPCLNSPTLVLTSRSFCTTPRWNDAPQAIIMNRYSRTVTQPKDQGASQVSPSCVKEKDKKMDEARLCCTRLRASTPTTISTKPWSALPASGESVPSFPLRWHSLHTRTSEQV